MDAQDFHNLQEAYREVVEGKVEWDNPKRPLQSGLTPREKNRTRRIATGVEDTSRPSFFKGGPGEKEYSRYDKLKAAHDEQKGKKVPANKRHKFKIVKDTDTGKTIGTRGQENRRMKTNRIGSSNANDEIRKNRYDYDLKEPKESYDIYDIILSHLLDEGYAETPEAAEAIMVNMSEEWREDIMEGYKRYPSKKVGNKLDRMYNDPDTDTRFGKTGKRYGKMMDVDSHMKGEVHRLVRAHSPKKSKAKEAENRARGQQG